MQVALDKSKKIRVQATWKTLQLKKKKIKFKMHSLLLIYVNIPGNVHILFWINES